VGSSAGKSELVPASLGPTRAHGSREDLADLGDGSAPLPLERSGLPVRANAPRLTCLISCVRLRCARRLRHPSPPIETALTATALKKGFEAVVAASAARATGKVLAKLTAWRSARSAEDASKHLFQVRTAPRRAPSARRGGPNWTVPESKTQGKIKDRSYTGSNCGTTIMKIRSYGDRQWVTALVTDEWSHESTGYARASPTICRFFGRASVAAAGRRTVSVRPHSATCWWPSNPSENDHPQTRPSVGAGVRDADLG
jgi:hypothetical protein